MFETCEYTSPQVYPNPLIWNTNRSQQKSTWLHYDMDVRGAFPNIDVAYSVWHGITKNLWT